jgi:hypothetical protein
MTRSIHRNSSQIEETAKGRPNKIIDPPSWRMIRLDDHSRLVQINHYDKKGKSGLEAAKCKTEWLGGGLT